MEVKRIGIPFVLREPCIPFHKLYSARSTFGENLYLAVVPHSWPVCLLTRSNVRFPMIISFFHVPPAASTCAGFHEKLTKNQCMVWCLLSAVPC